jgi:hypothetical protein
MADDLNPGIRRTVAWLNENGFATCDSGDGETHDHACDREEPYVVVQVTPPSALTLDADRLRKLLTERGIKVVPVGIDGGTWVQATYDPSNRIAFIDVSHIHDRLLT